MGFFDGLKKGASDLFAVGQQVAGMTLDAGLAALNGAKTLITDPKKFVEDTAHSVSELGRHAANSFSDGAVMIGDGWNEAWAAGNPGMFLWKALGGTAQMASLGVSDALKEHVERAATAAGVANPPETSVVPATATPTAASVATFPAGFMMA